MYGYGLSDIAISFIGVVILAVIVDRVTLFLQAIMRRIPFLPDEFEDYIVYVILVGLASAVCWQGHFDLFKVLNFTWHYLWEGYLLTGAMTACGSTLLIKEFKVLGFMPSVLSGMSSMFGFGSSSTINTDIDGTTNATPTVAPTQPESNQKGDV